MTDTQSIIEYYANLLIIQYLGKPKAFATIEAVVTPVLMGTSDSQFLKFSSSVSSGDFKLSYAGVLTASIAYNASAGTIESDLQAIIPFTVDVSGSIEDGLLFVFSDFTEAVEFIEVADNTLNGDPLSLVSPVGSQLPIAVQDGFNLVGLDLSIGTQLDIIGKYVGASRSGYGFNGPVTLNDTDYLTLIRMAIIRNNAGSSLAAIQAYIHRFFTDEIFVFDFANMNMSYLIDSDLGNTDLIQLVVAEDFLPRPMAVGLSVIVAPIIDKFFAFRTYGSAAWVNTTPFQTYGAYDTSWLWLSYQDSVPI
jgi:hypothetical protein